MNDLKMISKKDTAEFIQILKNNTKYGNPKIKGTPFAVFSILGESNKIFFGTYNKTKFELTKNATFFPTPFIIIGEVKSNGNKLTEVIYEVKPIGFGYYWLKYMPLFGVFIFNLIFYIESAPFEIFVLANSFLFGLIIYSYFYMRFKKSKFITVFKKVFEIET